MTVYEALNQFTPEQQEALNVLLSAKANKTYNITISRLIENINIDKWGEGADINDLKEKVTQALTDVAENYS